MSNIVYLANGDIVNMNIEKFTNTLEDTNLQQTIQLSQQMDFQLNSNIQNINEEANLFMLNLTANPPNNMNPSNNMNPANIMNPDSIMNPQNTMNPQNNMNPQNIMNP